MESPSSPLSILIATGNPGKAREFQEMLASDRLRWRSLRDCPGARTVEETGHTFRANACLKATGYARQFNTWALADDSGLEVDALGRQPRRLQRPLGRDERRRPRRRRQQRPAAAPTGRRGRRRAGPPGSSACWRCPTRRAGSC